MSTRRPSRQPLFTRIKETAGACSARGLKFTPSRQAVLEILWKANRPLGAYEILNILTDESKRQVAPPTVYRALDFLSEHRFISKLESQNSFVPCAHPDRSHACVFFICEGCGSTTEIENSRIEKLIEGNAHAIGFRVNRRIIELQGMCSACVGEKR